MRVLQDTKYEKHWRSVRHTLGTVSTLEVNIDAGLLMRAATQEAQRVSRMRAPHHAWKNPGSGPLVLGNVRAQALCTTALSLRVRLGWWTAC